MSDVAHRRSLLTSAAHHGNRISATPLDLGDRIRRRGRRAGSGPALRDTVGGKVVLVTGASSGIGRATALRVGRAGACVLLVARNTLALEEVATAIRAAGGSAEVYPCDLADLDAIDVLVDKIRAAHPEVHVLVNCAGKSIRRTATASFDRFQDVERPMRINYFAAVRLSNGVLPLMLEQGGGQIINISTWAVPIRPARFSGYTASKAALEAWADTVQAELVDRGIVFTNIRMPLVRTPMIAPTRAYRKVPALTPQEAARVVGEAMVTRSRRVTPLATAVPSLIDAVSPRMSDRLRRYSG